MDSIGETSSLVPSQYLFFFNFVLAEYNQCLVFPKLGSMNVKNDIRKYKKNKRSCANRKLKLNIFFGSSVFLCDPPQDC